MGNQVIKKSLDKISKKEENSLPIVRKYISPSTWALAAVVYTILIVKGTMLYLNHGQSTIVNIDEDKIIKSIQSQLEINEGQSHLPMIPADYISRNEFNRLKAELLEEFNKVNSRYVDIIKSEQSRSEKLIEDFVVKGPASVVNEDQGSQVLPYSIKNQNLMYAKYVQQRRRLEEEQEKVRLSTLKSLDMQTQAGQSEFKRLEDTHELQLKELEQGHYELMRKFEKQNYLIVGAN